MYACAPESNLNARYVCAPNPNLNSRYEDLKTEAEDVGVDSANGKSLMKRAAAQMAKRDEYVTKLEKAQAFTCNLFRRLVLNM